MLLFERSDFLPDQMVTTLSWGECERLLNVLCVHAQETGEDKTNCPAMRSTCFLFLLHNWRHCCCGQKYSNLCVSNLHMCFISILNAFIYITLLQVLTIIDMKSFFYIYQRSAGLKIILCNNFVRSLHDINDQWHVHY